jgi:hypothetical protein
MIHIIVATDFESKPLIQSFDLKKIFPSKSFDIFSNGNISLTVTGIGKINAALGVAHTFFMFRKQYNNIWINIGFAGSKSFKIGDLFLVNKIFDKDTKQTFFPTFVKKYNLKTADCTTFSSVDKKYENSLSDMELSSFFYSANKYSTKELIHSLKIISDNKNESMDFNNKRMIKSVFEKNAGQIDYFLKEIKKIWQLFFKNEKEVEKKINNDLSRVKHTFYEGVQLKKILKIFYYSKYSEKKILNYNESSKVNIKIIKDLLKI